MIMLRPLIGIRLRDYFQHIYAKVLLVVAVSAFLPSLAYFNMEDNFLRFLSVGALCVISVSASVYILGLSSNERALVKAKAIAILSKFLKK